MRSKCNPFPANARLCFDISLHQTRIFVLSLLCSGSNLPIVIHRTSNANRMLHFPLGPVQDELQPRDASHCMVNTCVLLLTFHAKHVDEVRLLSYLEMGR